MSRRRRVDGAVRPDGRAEAIVAGAVKRSVPIRAVIRATAAEGGRLLGALELFAPVFEAVFLVRVEVATKRVFLLPARRQCGGAEQHQCDPSGRFSRTR